MSFFGASESLPQLASKYLEPVQMVFPSFLFVQMLAAFLRNNNNPVLATIGVLSGGIINIFGDYFFVFVLNMGIQGAGLATAIGSAVSLIVMLFHFVSKKNTLKFVWPSQVSRKLKEIFITGFGAFFIDIAMGILTILFNRQIMKYLGTNVLSVYGIIVNISTFVQCRTSSSTDTIRQLCSPVETPHQRNLKICTLLDNIFQHFVDSIVFIYAEAICKYIYGTNRRNPENCSKNHWLLWSFLPASATEYIFHLLFSGIVKSKNCAYCVRLKRTDNQRNPSISAASFCSRRPMACHALN